MSLIGLHQSSAPRGDAPACGAKRRPTAACSGSSTGAGSSLVLASSPQLTPSRLWRLHSLGGASEPGSPAAAHSERADSHRRASLSGSGTDGGGGSGSTRRRLQARAAGSSSSSSSAPSGRGDPTLQQKPQRPEVAPPAALAGPTRPQRPDDAAVASAAADMPARQQRRPRSRSAGAAAESSSDGESDGLPPSPVQQQPGRMSAPPLSAPGERGTARSRASLSPAPYPRQRPTEPQQAWRGAGSSSGGSSSSSDGIGTGRRASFPEQRQAPGERGPARVPHWMRQQQQQERAAQQQQSTGRHQRHQHQEGQAPAPAFLTYGQQKQQTEQQAMLREKYYTSQQLRVPGWVRQLATSMLQVLATPEATAALAKGPDRLPPHVQEQLLILLPHPTAPKSGEPAAEEQRAGGVVEVEAAEAAEAAAAQQQQQQQEEEEEEARAVEQQREKQQREKQEREEQEAAAAAAAAKQAEALALQGEQQQQQQQLQQEAQQAGEAGAEVAATAEAGAEAGPSSAGDIFSAELAQILSHYQESQTSDPAASAPAAAGDKAGLVSGGQQASAMSTAASSTSAAGVSSSSSSSGGVQAGPAPEPATPAGWVVRQRKVDEGGFMYLMRAITLMGGGVRSAMAVLVAADASPLPYPTRSPAVFGVLFRVANSCLQHEPAAELVGYAQRWGVPMDRHMWQCVLDAAAKVGRPDLVRQLMKDMAASEVEPDSVTHTILLMAHEKAGQWEAVLDAYAEMQRLGLQRNSFTYRALVSSLVQAGRLESACDVLDWMSEDGVAGNAVVYQLLINAFLEKGQQDRVDMLLERMRREKVRFSHQAVGRLSGFCFSRGQPQGAFKLFKQVREMGLMRLEAAAPPQGQLTTGGGGSSSSGSSSSSSVVATPVEQQQQQQQQQGVPVGLGSLASMGSLSLDLEGSVSEVESELESETEGETLVVPAGLAGGAAEAAAVPPQTEAQKRKAAERLRQTEEAQAAHCYGRMIAACQKARLLDEAWNVYGWMREDGLSPDRSTYSRLISVCAYSPARGGDAVQLYDRLLAEAVELDAFMYLHLITAIASGEDGGAQRWPSLLRVLHGMQMGMPNYKDTHVQTVAVSLAAKHGRLGDALAVYRLMLQDGVQPKSPTFNALIAACMRAGAPASGFRFFEIMQGMGVKSDVVTVSTLIACCERLGDWRRAEEVWVWMEAQGLEPDTICYNTMISCMERSNQPDRALAVFERMMVAGVAGSSATYGTLCDVFAKQGKWDKLRTAVQVKEWMEGQGEDPAQVTYAQLMKRATQGGNWQRALELFDGMESSLTISGSQPNGITYSAAIIACARLADWQRALELKDQMLARGLPATPIVYNSVLAACEAAGQLEAALEILDEMRVTGVQRDQYTYSTLISCCYQVGGHLPTAMRLFEEMQGEGLTPNTVVTNALLSVCAAVGDADAAIQIYEHATGVRGVPRDDITMHCMMEALGRKECWLDGLRFFVASYEELGGHQGVMTLNMADPDAGSLDLHYLSVIGASIVLRAWLLHLRRCAAQGERLPPDATFKIITGWGRNSANNVPRLKPEVQRMLQQELGPPLHLTEPPNNTGLYSVLAQDMYEWLDRAQLGYSPEEEDQAWALMQTVRRRQQQERQAQQAQRQAQQVAQAQERRERRI